MIKIPGMMDPHVHLRSMEWSHKGTFASETAAALAGGYTLILDMPNTPPSTTSRAALDRKLKEIGAQAACDWGVYFGASQADNTDQYAGVSRESCGLKIYCNATTGDLLVEDQALRRRVYEAWSADRVIAVHAEGETVLEILDLVRKTRKWTHFCHISTAKEIDSLTRAKNEGLPVSVGVTPHHLYLTQDDLPTLGPLGLMKPELKTRADQRALWEALESGVVDVVESDHAPHTLAEKRSEKPPFGVPGLETTLSLLLLAVEEGRLTLERVVELVALNPRRVFGIADDPETYTLVDLDQSWVVEDAALRTMAKWSPFAGMRLPGRVAEVWLRGVKVFDGQDVLVADGFGTNRFGAA
jgi:dihydroorotase-like cyclic amidohydrolase